MEGDWVRELSNMAMESSEDAAEVLQTNEGES